MICSLHFSIDCLSYRLFDCDVEDFLLNGLNALRSDRPVLFCVIDLISLLALLLVFDVQYMPVGFEPIDRVNVSSLINSIKIKINA